MTEGELEKNLYIMSALWSVHLKMIEFIKQRTKEVTQNERRITRLFTWKEVFFKLSIPQHNS